MACRSIEGKIVLISKSGNVVRVGVELLIPNPEQKGALPININNVDSVLRQLLTTLDSTARRVAELLEKMYSGAHNQLIVDIPEELVEESGLYVKLHYNAGVEVEVCQDEIKIKFVSESGRS